MIEVAAGDRCPKCGTTVLDPLDPANREAVEAVRELRGRRQGKEWQVLLLVVLLVVVPVAVARFTTHDDLIEVAPYAILRVALLIVGALRLRRCVGAMPPDGAPVV